MAWTCGKHICRCKLWNLSNTDTLGAKIIVLISEVSLFQRENNMYLCKVGTQSSVLINQVSLFQGCPLRGVPLDSLHCIVLSQFGSC